jgi:hypothetical protein
VNALAFRSFGSLFPRLHCVTDIDFDLPSTGHGCVSLTGHGLDIAALTAVARFCASVNAQNEDGVILDAPIQANGCAHGHDANDLLDRYTAGTKNGNPNGYSNGHANGHSNYSISKKRNRSNIDGPEEYTTTKKRVLASRRVIESKIEDGKSVYGVTTGFGGSGTFLSSRSDTESLTNFESS